MKNRHQLDPSIIKECDIRGIAGESLHKDDAYFIGRSFGTLIAEKGKKNCVVARDGRLTSEDLCRSAVRGLRDSGIHVLDMGLIPTPALYFAVGHLSSGAGLMVTASHNPPDYNGFKFLTNDGPIYGNDIKELDQVCRSGIFAEGSGDYNEIEIISEYLSYLKDFQYNEQNRELKVIWDAGNGATAILLKEFTESLQGYHKIICGDVDGNFPNHPPDPTVSENVKQLRQTVLADKADLGIAFDGDGDRIVAVDGKGRMLTGDQLLVIYAREFLKDNPGERVMSEVKASRFLYDEIFAMGGEPVMWKVGHTNQKSKMKEDSIGLAGETSGHMFFSENKGFDDGLFAAIKLLNILCDSEESLADIIDDFPQLLDSGEIRINIPADKRHGIISSIKEQLIIKEMKHCDIDGIRTTTDEGFWMIRSSNTEPQLTLRCEARTEKGYRDALEELTSLLSHAGLGDDILGNILWRAAAI